MKPRLGEVGGAVQVLHDAEIHQQRASGARLDQDVVGLHVAVHQPVVVRVLERVEDRLDDPEGMLRRERALGPEQIGDRAPLQVGHGVVHQALALAHEMDRHRVGVVEPGDGAGLLLEPGDGAAAVQGRSERSTFTASRRWRSVSTTSYTSANPPRPIRRTTRYCRPSARREAARGRACRVGTGIERGDLHAEERQAPRPAPRAMSGALTQQGVAG